MKGNNSVGFTRDAAPLGGAERGVVYLSSEAGLGNTDPPEAPMESGRLSSQVPGDCDRLTGLEIKEMFAGVLGVFEDCSG